MHLVFNMLGIFFLGSALERLHGSLFLALLFLVTGIAGSGLEVATMGLEFLPESLRGSPWSIGASGALFGLFGFLWIRPSIDSSYPIRLVPTNVMLMLGWLVFCMTPLASNLHIANAAHLGGLLAGIAIALVLPQRLLR